MLSPVLREEDMSKVLDNHDGNIENNHKECHLWEDTSSLFLENARPTRQHYYNGRPISGGCATFFFTGEDASKSENELNLLTRADLQAWREGSNVVYGLFKDFQPGDSEKEKIIIRSFTPTQNAETETDIAYKIQKVPTIPGLNIFVLAPIDTPPGMKKEIKVLFTGTQDKAGVMRDLEEGAPGSQSFEASQDLIITAIADAAKNLKLEDGEHYQLSLRGHSLGGADTQHAMLAITNRMAQDLEKQKETIKKLKESSYTADLEIEKKKLSENQMLARIDSLDVSLNASPKVLDKQSDAFSKNLEAIKQKNQAKQIHLKTNLRVLLYDKDIVPYFGEKHIATDAIENGLIDQTRIVYLETEKPLTHKVRAYDPAEKIRAKRLSVMDITPGSSDIETEKATKLLNRTTTVDELSFTRAIMQLIRHVGKALGWIDDLPQKTVTDEEAAQEALSASYRHFSR